MLNLIFNTFAQHFDMCLPFVEIKRFLLTCLISFCDIIYPLTGIKNGLTRQSLLFSKVLLVSPIMAHSYSAELSQKIRRGMDINAEKCLSNGSNPGLGYVVDEERHFHIDPVGATVIREIFEMYASGKTVTEIIKHLNDKKVKTSLGREFNKNSLHRILRNKRYIGYYIYKDTEIPDGMPRILEDELFERV